MSAMGSVRPHNAQQASSASPKSFLRRKACSTLPRAVWRMSSSPEIFAALRNSRGVASWSHSTGSPATRSITLADRPCSSSFWNSSAATTEIPLPCRIIFAARLSFSPASFSCHLPLTRIVDLLLRDPPDVLPPWRSTSLQRSLRNFQAFPVNAMCSPLMLVIRVLIRELPPLLVCVGENTQVIRHHDERSFESSRAPGSIGCVIAGILKRSEYLFAKSGSLGLTTTVRPRGHLHDIEGACGSVFKRRLLLANLDFNWRQLDESSESRLSFLWHLTEDRRRSGCQGDHPQDLEGPLVQDAPQAIRSLTSNSLELC
jgi:hypothetical protein